ncbi:MAG: transcriptional regulator [Clostridia bacterium]|nr:transcriptional regulator [Clostridia bacterium]
MATRDQAMQVIKRFCDNRPEHVFKHVSELENGTRFVLMFLSEAETEVYASSISEAMNISRARVAVLLKKVEDKGYIRKRTSSKDARIEVVSLTEQGLKKVESMKERAIEDVMKVIEVVGIEEIDHFLKTAEKVKKIMEERI